MKRSAAAAAAVCAAFMLAGCNDITSAAPAETTAVSEASQTAAAVTEAQDTNYPVFAGSLEFTQAPRSIVSLSPAVTEMLYAVGGDKRLVAVGKYCDHPSEATELPQAGSPANPDISTIIAMSPELLISESPIAKKDMTDLSDAGIRVLVLSSPETVTALEGEYRMLSALVSGNDTASDAASAAMKEYYDAVGDISSSAGTFLLVMDDNYSVATGDTLAGSVMSAFGDNAALAYTNYSMPEEDIFSSDPDTVFLSSDVDPALFREDFAELGAVRNGRIIIIDTTMFERPTARLSGLVREVDEKLKDIPEETEAPTETNASTETNATEDTEAFGTDAGEDGGYITETVTAADAE